MIFYKEWLCPPEKILQNNNKSHPEDLCEWLFSVAISRSAWRTHYIFIQRWPGVSETQFSPPYALLSFCSNYHFCANPIIL